MTEGLDAALIGRLRAVAVAVAVQTGPGLDDAITLAEELVSSGLGGSGTVEVASLPRGSVRSDADLASERCSLSSVSTFQRL